MRDLFGVKHRQMFAYHRYPLNYFRRLPDFLIIGAQKAGTTSLHHYLAQSPHISPGAVKEAQYFNMNFERGPAYYKSLFPIISNKLTFEATPDYLDHPDAPYFCHQLIPNAKLIIMLREPVSRAFSHFSFVQTYDEFERKLSFEQGLEKEKDRIEKAMQLRGIDPFNAARMLSNYSYLRKGEYSDQIKNWLQFFPKERMLFLEFKDFADSTQEVIDRVSSFLEIPTFQLHSFKAQNITKYKKEQKESTKAALSDYFEDHNQQLFELIDQKYNW